MDFNPGLRGFPAYIGYAFLVEPIPGSPPGLIFSQGRYVSYIPSGSRADLNVAGAAQNISFRILNRPPQMGQPLDYFGDKSGGVCGNDERLDVIFKHLTPIGKFVINHEGKRNSWFPGNNSKFTPLDPTETTATPLRLIKKAQATYQAALDYAQEDIYTLIGINNEQSPNVKFMLEACGSKARVICSYLKNSEGLQ